MADEIKDVDLTQEQGEVLASPMALDLTALFKLYEEDILKLTENFEGTPEELIEEIVNLMAPQDAKELVTKSRRLEGRTNVSGFRVDIENNRGSIRRGVDGDGHHWQITMAYPYGYIRDVLGADGEELDCYVGDNRNSPYVFVIHQNDPDTYTYDEDKVMLGFSSEQEAITAYLWHYDRPGFFQSVSVYTVEGFKAALIKRRGSGPLSAPISINSNLTKFNDIMSQISRRVSI